MQRVLKLLVIGFVVVLLTACGGNSATDTPNDTNNDQEVVHDDTNDSNNTNINNPKYSNLNKGKFIDSNVFGLKYQTNTLSGYTNSNGEYEYSYGDQVSFKIGKVDLGYCRADEVVTPFDLSDSIENNNSKTNKLILLQTLDKDQNPENGIEIDSSTMSFFDDEKNANMINFNAKPDIFRNSLSKFDYQPVAKEDALKHFQNSIEKSCDFVFLPKKVTTCIDMKNNFLLAIYLQEEYKIAKNYEYIIKDIEDGQIQAEHIRETFEKLTEDISTTLKEIEGLEGKKTYELAKAVMEKLIEPLRLAMSVTDNKQGEEAFSAILSIFNAMANSASCKIEKNSDNCIEAVLNVVDTANSVYGVYNDGEVSEIVKDFLKYDDLIKDKDLTYSVLQKSQGLLLPLIVLSSSNNESVKVLKNIMMNTIDLAKCALSKDESKLSTCATAIGKTVGDSVSYFYAAGDILSKQESFNELRRHQTFYILSMYLLEHNLIRTSSINHYKEINEAIEANKINFNEIDDGLAKYSFFGRIRDFFTSKEKIKSNMKNSKIVNRVNDFAVYMYDILNSMKSGLLLKKLSASNGEINFSYYYNPPFPLKNNIPQNKFKIVCNLDNKMLFSKNITFNKKYSQTIPIGKKGIHELNCHITLLNKIKLENKILSINSLNENDGKPTLASISPNKIIASEKSQKIILRGNGFTEKSKVFYDNNNNKRFFKSSKYINSNTMQFNIRTMFGSPSKWKIWVQNGEEASIEKILYIDNKVNQVCHMEKKDYNTCSILNGIGTRYRICSNDGNSWGSYSKCYAQKCNTGYHEKNNECVRDDAQAEKITLYPESSCENNQPKIELSWNEIINVSAYKLHSNRVFPSGEYYKDVPQGENSIVLSNGLKSNYSYRLYIRAELDDGQVVNSNEVNVRTSDCDHSAGGGDAPDKPDSLSPGTRSSPYPELSDTDITLEWGAVSDADYYKVTLIDFNTKNTILDEKRVDTNNYNIQSYVRMGHEYIWSVMACNSGGCSSKQQVRFTIKGEVVAPDKPEGLTPGNTSKDNPVQLDSPNVNLRWNSADGANYYKVWVIQGALLHSGKIIVRGAQTTRANYAPSGLDKGQKYWWYVQSCNDDKCTDSDYLGFKIKSDDTSATPPSISSINPNPIPRSSDYQDITINGSHFASGSRVQWKTSNGSSGTVSSGNTHYQNSGRIRIHIRVGGSSSTWSFKVVNDDGTSSDWESVSISDNGGGTCALDNFTNRRLSETFNYGDKDTDKGGSKHQVRELQKFLNALGHNAGTPDGIYGDNTYYAVKRYQKANNLDDDGLVGPNTKSKINSTSCD